MAELWLSAGGKAAPSAVPAALAHDFLEAGIRLLGQPQHLLQAQVQFWQDYLTLWHRSAQRLFGQEAAPVAVPAKDDRRFKSEGWQEPVFDLIKQGYLLSARCLQTTLSGVEGLDEGRRKRIDFYTRQFVDAVSPSNFVLTNPEVLRATARAAGRT